MILELNKFEAFPARIDLVDTECRGNVGMPGISSIDKTMLGLDIQKFGDEYYCRGRLEAEVTLECARCLEPIKQKLADGTDFIALPHESGPAVVKDDEDRVYYDAELKADLWEIVRQTVILAVSMKPLCQEDCRGLCPQCGTNLNEKRCKCEARVVDARLEPLKKLLSVYNRKG